jgi:hypothetical protein
MTDAELATMPVDVRDTVLRSSFYRPVDDQQVKPERTDWRRADGAPGGAPNGDQAGAGGAVHNVLVVCPTYRLEPRTVEAIFAFQWDGPIDYYFTRDNPYRQDVRRGYFNIWHNLVKARQMFLNANYDAMLIVESDILAPTDTLTKLAGVDADVVGGLYVMRHGTPVANAFVYVPGQVNPGTYLEALELRGRWGGVVRTNGVCTGCVLIRRHVIEQIPFRMHEMAAPDWAFMEDCNQAGLVTVCDTSVICGHKRPDGVVLWPSRDRGWFEQQTNELLAQWPT